MEVLRQQISGCPILCVLGKGWDTPLSRIPPFVKGAKDGAPGDLLRFVPWQTLMEALSKGCFLSESRTRDSGWSILQEIRESPFCWEMWDSAMPGSEILYL